MCPMLPPVAAFAAAPSEFLVRKPACLAAKAAALGAAAAAAAQAVEPCLRLHDLRGAQTLQALALLLSVGPSDNPKF